MGMLLRRLANFRIRKNWRRRACNDLFVILENMPGRHQIDDICSGGLSYHYIGNGDQPKMGTYTFRVVLKGQSSALSLLGRTVGERETGALVSQNKVIRRRSIRFERLDSHQKKVLKEIIKEHTVRN